MVTILMSTFNGHLYLTEQLDSIFHQDSVDINVLVRDDGSIDNTRLLLESYSKSYPLKWYTGANLRPARSFWDLIQSSPSTDYYALSDQDDYWLPEKLKTAVEMLSDLNDIPALYFSQTQWVDAQLNSIKTQKIIPSCTLGEALICHNATGCTFVFNNKLMQLLREYTPEYFSMHDNWIYRVCLAVGGTVVFDSVPHIYYRQHENNVIGLKRTRLSNIKDRYNRLFNKERERSKLAKELLKGYKQYMSTKNACLLQLAADCPTSLLARLKLIFKREVSCSSVMCNITSRLSILLGTY